MKAQDGIRDWSVTGLENCVFVFSSRRRHTRLVSDWSSDVCSSDLEIIFKVSIRVLVIVSPRSSLEKLSGEQAGIAKPEVESFIKLVFGNEIEFVADVKIGRASCRERV